jgi:hypothetical protein
VQAFPSRSAICGIGQRRGRGLSFARRARPGRRKTRNLTLVTRQTFFNLAALALLALLALNTASIARSLRRIERIDRHRLVGWYLMSPPIRPVGKTLLGPQPIETEDVEAPLSQWSIAGTFPTEAECEAYQHRQAARFEGGPPIASTSPIIIAAPWERCISADDPRLKPSP